jgi:hypothetical protein
MRKPYKNRKALSTVISSILMIMVVMVGMTIAFASVVVYADTYQKGAGSAVLESLTIEDIWLKNSGTDNMELWIYNVGSLPVTVEAIYVVDNPLDVSSFVSYPASGSPEPKEVTDNLNIDGPIPVGGRAHITATFDGQIAGEIKIATQRGLIIIGDR